MTKDDARRLASSVRRSSLALGLAAGLLAGSILTAAVRFGDDGTSPVASSGPSAAPAAASAPTTAPDGAPTGPTAPTGPSAPTPTGPASTLSRGAPGGAAPGGAPGRAAAPAVAVAAASSTSCTGTPATGVRGVTDTTIKIGVAIPDVAPFYPLAGPEVRIGDQEAHFRAHLDALRKKGVLPVCGRDIVPVFRKFVPLDPSQSRAVCQAFVNDDKVFAVVSQSLFADPNCVTQENKTFLMDAGSLVTLANFDASGGRLFTLDPPVETQWQIWATWVSARIAGDKKVGVYYNNSSADSDGQVRKYVIDVLRRHGHDPVVATTNTPEEVAVRSDPNDAVAVQRFRVEGVQVALVVTKGSGFVNEARRQGYRPVFPQFNLGVGDNVAGTYDPEYMDGTPGIHWKQQSDGNAGVPPAPRSEECVEEVEAAGIPRPHRDWGEWKFTMVACDEVAVIVGGLHGAGRNLTTDRLALSVQTLVHVPAALFESITYSPTKHWGVGRDREARYFKECRCWKNVGPWEPLFL